MDLRSSARHVLISRLTDNLKFIILGFNDDDIVRVAYDPRFIYKTMVSDIILETTNQTINVH